MLTSETCARGDCVAIAGRPGGKNKDHTTRGVEDVVLVYYSSNGVCGVYGAAEELYLLEIDIAFVGP